MRTAALVSRHGRLLALCALSVLLHVGVIVSVGAPITAPSPLAGTAELAVRLARPTPAVPAPPSLPTADAPLGREPPEEPAPPAPVVEAPLARVLNADAAAALPAPGAEPAQMPSRYRVAVPPSVTLAYEVRDASGAIGEGSLAWETDGVQYRLAVEGIMGKIESEGGTDDAGLAPLRASYRFGAGSASITFDREQRVIMLEGFGRSVPDAPGSQDGATVLMQLAGIALADPDQMQEAVDIHVARADGASVEHFQVVGRQQLATPAGAMDTLHLARSGAVRLEVWLAPAHGWLPVQLRTTAPDGSVRTQVVKEISRKP